MLPTVWTETAVHDAETLMAYLRERNPHAARRIRNLIVETAVGLGQQPYAYREGREPDTREVVVHPNYILIYRVELSAVRVVRVLHASQQYPRHFDVRDSMKLYITAPSPFARKCRIVAREKGLADRIEEVVVDPYGDDPVLLAANPVVQVPTLIAEDGLPVSDSPVICDWLDEIGTGPRLCPPAGPERLRVKRLETLGNAALEMGVKLVLEKRRPEAERSPSWIARWTANMARTLDALEAVLPDGEPEPDVAMITAAVAASWIGFRHPDFDWSGGRPRLEALTRRLEARPSFRETAPA